MTTTQYTNPNPRAQIGASGFQSIPTRIKDTPPLVIDKDEALRSEVVSRIEAVAASVATTHRAAAEAYLSQGMYDEALPHLEAAVRFGNELEYTNQLGFVHYLRGDDETAIACFQDVIRQQPGNADALFNLGMVLFGQQRIGEAEECFRRALESRPDDAEIWNNRGVCLFQSACLVEARACFERALQLDPSHEDARFNLQNCSC